MSRAKRSRRVDGAAVLLLVLVSFAGTGPACAVQAHDSEEATPSRVDGSLRKLGRGIANVATAPAELIRTPQLTTRREGYIAGLSIGIVEGAWRTVERALTGIFEIGTFYAEIPKDYGPLMKPEFVWAHGDWLEN